MDNPSVGYDYGHGSCFDPHQALLNETSRNARDSARGHADILRDIGLAAASANARFCDTIGTVKDAAKGAETAIRQVGCDAIAATKDASKSGETTTIEQSGRVSGVVRDGLLGLERAGAAGFASVEKSLCHTGERLDDKFASAASQVCGIGQAITGGFKDAQAQGYLSEGRLKDQATMYANAASVMAVDIGNRSQVNADRIRAELGMLTSTGFQQAGQQAERIASDSRFYAQANASTAAAQLAQVRCDILEKIESKGNAILAQGNDLELHRTRQELADAKAALAACCGPCGGRGHGGGGGNGPGNGNNAR